VLRVIGALVKLRLFVAIEIDELIRSLAHDAVSSLAAVGVIGRFELPEKMHVTVAFLGSTPESNLPAVAQALYNGSSSCSPFALDFERIGAFPNERRPRVIWIGPAKESAAFAACAGRVRAAFEPLGFTFEHDASAHITICRPKIVPSHRLPKLRSRATLEVRGLTLFRSIPAGPTTRYEALDRTTFPAGCSSGA
jgi:RNA 2',3'-cyclic 3'-phosphodiesterase